MRTGSATGSRPARHRAVRHSLALYALGALTGEEHSAVEKHLHVCPPCHAVSVDFARVVAALSLVSADRVRAVPDGVE